LFTVYDPVVWGMAGIRFLSSGIEFSAALLMLYFGRVETAFKINAVLSFVGPAVLCTVTFLGLCGLAGRLSPVGLTSVLAGVALIFLGLHHLRS
jgi:hypothetical protein